LLVDGGTCVVAAFVSPYRTDRDSIRALFPSHRFAEVFVRCPLGVCEERDPKGLYLRARAGRISDFTGVSSPYEEPLNPELILDTNRNDVKFCVAKLKELAMRLSNESADTADRAALPPNQERPSRHLDPLDLDDFSSSFNRGSDKVTR
jgi:adenylylsulfate kinase-like enzyme